MNAQEHIDELQKLKDETTKLATELKWTKKQLESVTLLVDLSIYIIRI